MYYFIRGMCTGKQRLGPYHPNWIPKRLTMPTRFEPTRFDMARGPAARRSRRFLLLQAHEALVLPEKANTWLTAYLAVILWFQAGLSHSIPGGRPHGFEFRQYFNEVGYSPNQSILLHLFCNWHRSRLWRVPKALVVSFASHSYLLVLSTSCWWTFGRLSISSIYSPHCL